MTGMFRINKILFSILLLPAVAVRGDAKSEARHGSRAVSLPDTTLTKAISKSGLPNLFSAKTFLKVEQTNLSLSTNYLNDTSGAAMGMMNTDKLLTDYRFDGGVSMLNMPFKLNLAGSNNAYSFGGPALNNLYKFNFDPKAYLDNIKKTVLAKADPKALLNATMARINAIKAQYEKSLTNEIMSIKADLMKKYNTTIDIPAEAGKLNTSDLASLQNKLIGKDQIDNYTKSAQVLQNAGAQNGNTKDSTLVSAEQAVQKYEALQKVYEKLIYWKKRFESDKIVRELRSHLEANDLSAYFSDPNNLKNAVTSNFQLGGLQSLFMNVSRFDAGQNAVAPTSPFSPQNVINTGVNTAFANKKFTAGAIVGKNSSVNQQLLGGLRSGVTDEYNNLSGFSFGSAAGSKIEQSVSLNIFSFNDNAAASSLVPSAASFDPVIKRKDIVVTIHSGMDIAPGHHVVLDLSKSVGQFAQGIPDSNKSAQALLPSLFNSEEGAANYAVSLDYKGEITGGTVGFFVKKVGMGYNNPGNYLLRKGEMQIGADFAKLFLKDKVNVKFKLKYKDQAFDPDRTSTNKSWETRFSVGYKIDRNNKLTATYQARDYNTAFLNMPVLNGVYERFDLNGAYKIRYHKKTIINNTSFGLQSTQLPFLNGQMYDSRSLFFTHNSSLVLGNNVASLTVNGTSSNNNAYYFNNSQLNVESGYTYTLFHTMKASSSLGYYTNTGWNKQIGIGQQISATLMKKMSVDLSVNYKKAVEIIQTGFANQFYFTTGIHYQF
jgi:hypothetical protein